MPYSINYTYNIIAPLFVNCLGQKTAKELFGFRVKLFPAYLPTVSGLHTVEASNFLLQYTAEYQAAKSNFSNLWFYSLQLIGVFKDFCTQPMSSKNLSSSILSQNV